ncbi:SmtA SAM-dependent methyltransferases [uncultured Caudovirales phage]|uniref:SmtA SAM-dependent methyltransferases n=1 Tax=uncultured Caudovirales phage TaxID=2100421 RepID=A0A6J5QQM0_9CAUD|nr:SmtA SAM-dependent methyltransferases [uncultured Caudovirales phage]CAB4212374.1 SmtA SAM-dependent methyltransferases [uncultured Caudovirales phage]
MVGQHSDKEFKIEDYENFYEHHQFGETSDEDAESVHEIVPRFGWGFDIVEEFKPKNLLDLGTLDGSFPITISKHFDIPVTGIDLTKDGIGLAKERAKRLGLDATFLQGTIEDRLRQLSKEGKKFDLITCFEVIEHVKDVSVLLKLIDEVLAPDGNVLVSTPDFESPLYGKDDEKNKCHIRLFTIADDDYEGTNKYGNVRIATSMSKSVGKERVKELGVYSHLINCRYQ